MYIYVYILYIYYILLLHTVACKGAAAAGGRRRSRKKYSALPRPRKTVRPFFQGCTLPRRAQWGARGSRPRGSTTSRATPRRGAGVGRRGAGVGPDFRRVYGM